MVIIFPNIHVHNCLMIIIYLCWLGVEVNIPSKGKYMIISNPKKRKGEDHGANNKNSRRNPKIPSIHLDNVPIWKEILLERSTGKYLLQKHTTLASQTIIKINFPHFHFLHHTSQTLLTHIETAVNLGRDGTDLCSQILLNHPQCMAIIICDQVHG